MEPTAWVYELATAYNKKTGEYSHWNRMISFRKPSVPSGSLRNLQPLYTEEQFNAKSR